jgi:hypothetical protein
MSGSSGGSTISLSDGTPSVTTNITRPQEPPPPTPIQGSHHHNPEGEVSSEQIVGRNHQSPQSSPGTNKRNSTVMMITNEDKSGGRTAGIDNPGFEEDDERPATVGNGGSVSISVTAPSNGTGNTSSFLNSSGLDTSMLTEMKDKDVAEAVNLELVSMNPFSTTLETNGVNGIPVKKDGEQAGLGDGYADPYDEYFVPVNEHRKYMRWVCVGKCSIVSRRPGATNRRQFGRRPPTAPCFASDQLVK